MKRIFSYLMIMILVLSSTLSYADEDYAELVLIYDRLKTQLDELSNIKGVTQQMKQQLDNDINNEISKLTGSYGMGALMDSSSDFNNRNWSPSDWQTALQDAAGGNNARYQQLMQAYEKYNPSLTKNDFEKGGSTASANYYTHTVQTNRAAYVTSAYEFNDIQNSLKEIHQLNQQIDQTTDEKQISDLSARLIGQVGYLIAQMIKMQTVQAQLAVQNNQGTVNTMAVDAQFNQ